MSMGDRGEIVAGCKNARKQAAWFALAAHGMREIHAHGSHAHHSAAAFAVVRGPRHFAAAGLQVGDVGGALGEAARQFLMIETPDALAASRPRPRRATSS